MKKIFKGMKYGSPEHLKAAKKSIYNMTIHREPVINRLREMAFKLFDEPNELQIIHDFTNDKVLVSMVGYKKGIRVLIAQYYSGQLLTSADEETYKFVKRDFNTMVEASVKFQLTGK